MNFVISKLDTIHLGWNIVLSFLWFNFPETKIFIEQVWWARTLFRWGYVSGTQCPGSWGRDCSRPQTFIASIFFQPQKLLVFSLHTCLGFRWIHGDLIQRIQTWVSIETVSGSTWGSFQQWRVSRSKGWDVQVKPLWRNMPFDVNWFEGNNCFPSQGL